MKNNIPEVGDWVKINPECKEKVEQNGSKLYLSDHDCDWYVVEVSPRPVYIGVYLKKHPEDTAKYAVGLTPNGYPVSDSRSATSCPFFILAGPVEKEQPDNSLYCSCGGYRKQSWTFTGEPFWICSKCKKEKK